MHTEQTTDFGYQRVPVAEKAARVAGVFDAVADNYDRMNDLMSGGLHRLWKFFATEKAAVRSGQRVLDIAGGSGDLSAIFARQVGPVGQVVLADINAAMLERGRDRLLDRGCGDAVRYVQADAAALPFPDNYFDCIGMAFGLRNVTDKAAALESMLAVLKPGGRLVILEFSKPVSPLLAKVYDRYSFSLLPRLGQWVAGDAAPYRYLAESIRMHPDQEALKAMLESGGFVGVDYANLSGGIVALHWGFKA
ncbi:MAG: bifunctional demethylmenaquinone methyltransferase/2-methoxy-6-polyprenyl-1,4-benzoquinol methylase UbiE [Cellvibrionales bacterium]|nr:bifunctional demethylmenaquinone methyltransferase/2-methoxy-6-polyprenyl-1,4-benzoquinol methylase UbiE [Cellvibrionales bacterium]